MPTEERLQRGDLATATVAVLQSLLDKNNLSYRQLAKSIGKSHTYVNNRFTGTVDLTLTDLDAICERLGVSASDVLSPAWKMANADNPAIYAVAAHDPGTDHELEAEQLEELP